MTGQHNVVRSSNGSRKDLLHAEIAARYGAAERDSCNRRKGRPLSVRSLRAGEVKRILLDRYGRFLPNNGSGRDAIQLVAECLVLVRGDVRQKIEGFIVTHAPWAVHEIDAVTEAAVVAARWLSPDEMAWRIALSVADRKRLRIRTIGAVGVTARQRKTQQKNTRAEREAERRRDAGAKSREDYLVGSLSRTEPWKQLGISRAQWYRRRKRQDETSPCPIFLEYIISHGPVSPTTGPAASRAAPSAGERALSLGEAPSLSSICGGMSVSLPHGCGMHMPMRGDGGAPR